MNSGSTPEDQCKKANEHTTNHKLKLKVKCLSAVIKDLKKQQLVSKCGFEVVNNLDDSVPSELLQRMLHNEHEKITTHEPPSPDLRSFALTLQWYSARAKDMFSKSCLCLPYMCTIHKWFYGIDGLPGCSKGAFDPLKMQAKKEKSFSRETVVAFFLDEMRIKTHTDYVGEMMVCCTDTGSGIQDDANPLTTDTLVFVATSLNGSWKIHLGYFFIASFIAARLLRPRESKFGQNYSCRCLYQHRIY